MTRGRSAWRVAALALLFAATTAESCQYDVRVPLPTHIASIHVAPFLNRTQQEGLEGWVTDAVIQQFVTNGRLAVLPRREDADAEIAGEILEYRRTPISWDQTNTVVQFKVQILARVRFEDRVKGETLQDEAVDGVTTYSVLSSPPENERDAILRAADEMARDIITLVVEGRQFQDDDLVLSTREGETVQAGGILRR